MTNFDNLKQSWKGFIRKDDWLGPSGYYKYSRITILLKVILPGRVKKLVLRLVLTAKKKLDRKDSIAKTIGLAHLVTIYVQLPDQIRYIYNNI